VHLQPLARAFDDCVSRRLIAPLTLAADRGYSL